MISDRHDAFLSISSEHITINVLHSEDTKSTDRKIPTDYPHGSSPDCIVKDQVRVQHKKWTKDHPNVAYAQLLLTLETSKVTVLSKVIVHLFSALGIMFTDSFVQIQKPWGSEKFGRGFVRPINFASRDSNYRGLLKILDFQSKSGQKTSPLDDANWNISW